MINPCLLAQQSHVIIAGANESAKCQPVGISGGIKPVIGFLHTCEIGKQTVSSTTFHDIKLSYVPLMVERPQVCTCFSRAAQYF